MCAIVGSFCQAYTTTTTTYIQNSTLIILYFLPVAASICSFVDSKFGREAAAVAALTHHQRNSAMWPDQMKMKKKIKLEMMNCVIAIEWHDDEEWWLCDGMANVEWQTKWLDYRSEQIRATCTVSIHETNSSHSVYPCDFDAMTEERWDKYVALTIYSVVELEAILLFPPHIFLINLSVGCVCVSSVFTPSLSLFLSSMAADNYHCNQLNIRYYYLLNAVWITHFFAFLFVPGKRPNHILWSEQIAMMMMANTNTEFYLSDTEVRLNTDA